MALERIGVQESWLFLRGSAPLSSRIVHALSRKSCKSSRRFAQMNKTQMQEGSIQEMEIRTDDPGGISRHCLSMQGRAKRSQRPSRVKSHEICESQQERLLLIHKQQKED